MCLEVLDEKTYKARVGFKVVEPAGKEAYAPVYLHTTSCRFKLNEWTTTRRPGFHAFLTLRDAKEWRDVHACYRGRILKVRLRKVIASGIDKCHSLRAVLAKQVMPIEVVSSG